MSNHTFKAHPGPFKAIIEGRKAFELRDMRDRKEIPRADLDFLRLEEWSPGIPDRPGIPGKLAFWTGRYADARVTYVCRARDWVADLPEGIYIFGIEVLRVVAAGQEGWTIGPL